MSVFTKDPDAIVDFQIDWGAAYLAAGETIQTSSWSVLPADSLVLGTETSTSTNSKIYVSGGAAGQVCHLTNHIVTSGGRADDRSFTIRVTEA